MVSWDFMERRCSQIFDIYRCNDQGNADLSKFAKAQKIAVPVDDKRPLKVKIEPTYMLDTVTSIQLNSFRKVIGYDTF